MEAHYQLSDSEFVLSFQQKSLNPKWFTHEAHLRLAWIYIHKYGIETAADRLCKHIREYALFLGETEKFNQTLTIAAAKVVNHFIQKYLVNNFSKLLEQEPRLKHNFLDLIKSH